MSLVVAIKRDGIVYLGADTRTTRGEHVRATLAEEDLKIHRMGSCLVGAAGTVSNIQVLTNHPEWFDLKGKPLTKKFILKNIVPKFFDLLGELGRLEIDENGDEPPRSMCSFLFTDGERLFMMDNDFEVIELSTYGQVGCTEYMALSMFLNALDEYSPNEIILKALRTSAYRNDGVGAPYVLINTRDREFEMVEE